MAADLKNNIGKELVEGIKGEDWERERGKGIVDMLAAEGATYSEAFSIIKSAEYELGNRKYNETKNKKVAEIK